MYTWYLMGSYVIKEDRTREYCDVISSSPDSCMNFGEHDLSKSGHVRPYGPQEHGLLIADQEFKALDNQIDKV